MAAAGCNADGIAFKILHLFELDDAITGRVNDFQAITGLEAILDQDFGHAGGGIHMFDVAHILAAGGFRMATQIILRFLAVMALIEAIGIAAIGQAFQLA